MTDAYRRSISLQDLPSQPSSSSFDMAIDRMKGISEETEAENRQSTFYISATDNSDTEVMMSPTTSVFDDPTDSGTEEESVNVDGSVAMAPSPMEEQGPRRLKQTMALRKARQVHSGSGRFRKGSVPVRIQVKEEARRKVPELHIN